MSNVNVKSLVRKVAALLPQLEERGTVYFFALGERAELNLWEVILSSQWSDQGYALSVFIVGKALMQSLTPSELQELASISIIPSHERNIAEMPKNLEEVMPDEERTIDFTLMGLEIRRAYIFKAQRPSLTNVTVASAA